ncbi:hypothetical protein OUZ56_022440 [Daphnia magna]|uniref:Uncharacterized protein n=1 Tax=Daphnia magna TaxID=35525 RepID=A0ABR0AWE5_9CRUS|nr:hypothetical protein OUZ56_022440 [Daphnia magna]
MTWLFRIGQLSCSRITTVDRWLVFVIAQADIVLHPACMDWKWKLDSQEVSIASSKLILYHMLDVEKG